LGRRIQAENDGLFKPRRNWGGAKFQNIVAERRELHRERALENDLGVPFNLWLL
jgi:hypothetical protein